MQRLNRLLIARNDARNTVGRTLTRSGEFFAKLCGALFLSLVPVEPSAQTADLSTAQPPYSIWRAPSQKIAFDAHAPKTLDELRAASVAELLSEKWTAARRADPQTMASEKTTAAEVVQWLRDIAGASLEIHLRPENGTPRQIKGRVLHRPDQLSAVHLAERDEKTARAFLKRIQPLLRLHDPDAELKLIHRQTDERGRRRLRFVQVCRGLEVWPDELSVHLEADGNVDLLEGAFVPTPRRVEVIPRLSAEEAVARARARPFAPPLTTAELNETILPHLLPPHKPTPSPLPGGEPGTSATIVAPLLGGAGGGFRRSMRKTPELIICAPLDEPARLAWKFELGNGAAEHWLFVIDAINGTALQAVNLCRHSNVRGSGTDLLGVKRGLNVTEQNDAFVMIDRSKPMFNAATGKGTITILDAANARVDEIMTGDRLKNSTVSSPVADSWAPPDAVSGAFNLSEAYDYFRERFGRNSYDDLGGDVSAVVRVRGLEEAIWSPLYKTIFFGIEDRFVASLDVVAHEFSHGVIGSIGGVGVLGYTKQPGALQEAFADIFGEMAEARTTGSLDWILGSQMNEPVRNLSNPPALFLGRWQYPATMREYWPLRDTPEEDHGGVHVNSTIISRAYYFLAQGLRSAIGLRDAERIFYRCLTLHMQRQSQFVDARLACVASAEELFGIGSPQALKTAEAFEAVELFAAPASVVAEGARIQPINAPDATLFLYTASNGAEFAVGRYETAQGDRLPGIELAPRAKLRRPSVSGDGSAATFVDDLDGICVLDTRTGDVDCLLPGQVHAVAISGDANRSAYVFKDPGGAPSDKIVFVELSSGSTFPLTLVTPVVDGPALRNILQASTLDFAPAGNLLVYDALSRAPQPDGSFQEVWGIYTVDFSSLDLKVVVPPGDGTNYIHPAFAQTSDRFITFEAELPNGHTDILVLDLTTGKRAVVARSMGGAGYPGFTGDDSAIVYASNDVSSPSVRSLFRQALSADKLTAAGRPGLWLRDAYLGVIYRRGRYIGLNSPPFLRILQPASGTSFASQAPVLIEASATDRDGSVSQVEFFEGSKLLGRVATAPYRWTWTNAPAGNYRIYARATDNLGGVTTSLPLNVAIRPRGAEGRTGSRFEAGFELSLSVSADGIYRIEASTDLVNWTSLGTVQSLNRQLNFTDQGTARLSFRYYRAVRTP